MAALKILKDSITSRSYAVTYNETLEEVMWLLSLEKPKNPQKFSKNSKKMQVLSKILIKFVIKKFQANP